MGDDDSANKAVGQEGEGNTAPFPEKVFFFCNFNGLRFYYYMKYSSLMAIFFCFGHSTSIIVYALPVFIDLLSVPSSMPFFLVQCFHVKSRLPFPRSRLRSVLYLH